MRPAKPDYGIYLVTDNSCLAGRSLLECVKEALGAGCGLVQYRAKDKSSREMYEEALALKRLCDAYGKCFIVNDRLDIAIATGASGVHLGQSDLPCAVARKATGPSFIIGVSAHDEEEAIRAQQDGADYLGCGAVFGTKSKEDAATLGIERLSRICSRTDIPVVGIGGVNAANYGEVLAAGARGAAFISGILKSDDIAAEVAKLSAVYRSRYCL